MEQIDLLINTLSNTQEKLGVPKAYTERFQLLKDAQEAFNPNSNKSLPDWIALFRTPGGWFAPKYPLVSAIISWMYSSMLLILPLVKILGEKSNDAIFIVWDFGLGLIPASLAFLWHLKRAMVYMKRQYLLENALPTTEEEARQNIVQAYLKLYDYLESERTDLLSFAQALQAKILDSENTLSAEYEALIRVLQMLEEKVQGRKATLDLLERLRKKANAALLFTTNSVNKFFEDDWLKDAKVIQLLEDARAQVSEQVYEPLALCELVTSSK